MYALKPAKAISIIIIDHDGHEQDLADFTTNHKQDNYKLLATFTNVMSENYVAPGNTTALGGKVMNIMAKASGMKFWKEFHGSTESDAAEFHEGEKAADAGPRSKRTERKAEEELSRAAEKEAARHRRRS